MRPKLFGSEYWEWVLIIYWFSNFDFYQHFPMISFDIIAVSSLFTQHLLSQPTVDSILINWEERIRRLVYFIESHKEVTKEEENHGDWIFFKKSFCRLRIPKWSLLYSIWASTRYDISCHSVIMLDDPRYEIYVWF